MEQRKCTRTIRYVDGINHCWERKGVRKAPDGTSRSLRKYVDKKNQERCRITAVKCQGYLAREPSGNDGSEADRIPIHVSHRTVRTATGRVKMYLAPTETREARIREYPTDLARACEEERKRGAVWVPMDGSYCHVMVDRRPDEVERQVQRGARDNLAYHSMRRPAGCGCRVIHGRPRIHHAARVITERRLAPIIREGGSKQLAAPMVHHPEVPGTTIGTIEKGVLSTSLNRWSLRWCSPLAKRLRFTTTRIWMPGHSLRDCKGARCQLFAHITGTERGS